jgi:hypothetical protein
MSALIGARATGDTRQAPAPATLAATTADWADFST